MWAIIFCCLFAVLALTTCPAAAAPQARAGTDTTDTASSSASTRQQPRAALIRSAVVPGWGQYGNGHPIKAAVFSTAAIGLLAAVVVDADNLSQTDREIRDARARLAALAATGGDDANLLTRIGQLEREFEDRAARRNTRLLYLFTTATLAAVDAYVDAHLADFHVVPRTDGVFVNLRLGLPAAVLSR